MEFPLALTGPASHTVLFLPSLPRGTVTSLSNSRVDIHRYRLLPPSTAQSHCCGVHAVGSWDVSFLTGKEGLTGGAKTREEWWKRQFIARGVYQGVFLGSTPVDGKETLPSEGVELQCTCDSLGQSRGGL